MNSALGFHTPRPATGTGLFACRYRAGAVGAANTGIALIVQRIIRQIVGMDIGPKHFFGPGGEGGNLDIAMPPILADDGGLTACGGLVAADSGEPRIVIFEGAFQRRNFALVAAEIRI